MQTNKNGNTERKADPELIMQLMLAADAAEIPIYGTDFLCRTLAILHCYGGGPGAEHFRAPVGHAVAMRAGKMLEEAVLEKNWDIVKKVRAYVAELQSDRASWLEKTLDRLNIPAREIQFSECVQPESPKGT